MRIIHFDSQDSATREFLETLGLPEKFIQKGKVKEKTLLKHGIDPALFGMLARLGRPQLGNETNTLSHDEAIKALELIRKEPRKIQALFDPNSCPNGLTARTIFTNLSGRRTLHKSKLGAVLETSCSVEELQQIGFEHGELKNAVFNEEQMPSFWQEIGKAVLPLSFGEGKQEKHASGVLVSPQGHLLTAYHVLFDTETGEYRDGLKLIYEGNEYLLETENIVISDIKSDLAIVKFPELENISDLSFVKFASADQEEQSPVLAIGYPTLSSEELETHLDKHRHNSRYDPEEDKKLHRGLDQLNTEVFQKSFSLGLLFSKTRTEYSDGSGIYMRFDADIRVYSGNSGGGLFNIDGELLGIVSTGMAGTVSASSIFSQDAISPELGRALEHIVTLQREQ